jgi:hypothetical protein
MPLIHVAQFVIFGVLSIGLFLIEVWAFVNALRFRADAYTAADKRTKAFWCVLTGVAFLLGLLGLPIVGGPGSSMLFMLIGIGIAGIFLADVYPALKAVMGRSRNNRW